MARDLQSIADEVSEEIVNRTDARSRALKYATRAYRNVCQLLPFPNLQKLSDDFTTVADQSQYDISALDLAGIMSIRYTNSAGRKHKLVWTSIINMDRQGSDLTGRPSTYTRCEVDSSDHEQIQLNPAPDTAGETFKIRYWSMPTIDASQVGSHTLVTPVEWDELLVYMALERTYISYEEFAKAQALVIPTMMPRQYSTKKVYQVEMGIIGRLLNDLLQTSEERENVDSSYQLNPVYRRYTRGVR